jgi:glycosyltransferase involved in cell wall biosynthesis
MYETVRELVAEERKQGVDAWIYDPRTHGDPANAAPAWTEDRGVCTVPKRFLPTADLFVSHSGLEGPPFEQLSIPRIHVAHGRPNSSYRIERSGQTPIYTCYAQMHNDPRWKMMVTFWPGYEQYLGMLFPDVRVVPAFVDLDHWMPGSVDPYDFAGKGGEKNVAVTDIWRKDKDPFFVLHAMRLLYERRSDIKVHVYGLDPNDQKGAAVLVIQLREIGALGDVKPLVQDLRPVYEAADCVATPHTIATRVVRETLAMGTQLAAGAGNPYTPYQANIEDLSAFAEVIEQAVDDAGPYRTGRNRQMAQDEFDVRRSVSLFLELAEEAAAEAILI